MHTPAVVKKIGGFEIFSANPKSGGPTATPKKRTVPYKQVTKLRSVLGAEEVISAFNILNRFSKTPEKKLSNRNKAKRADHDEGNQT